MTLFLVIFLPFLPLPRIGKGYRQLGWGPPSTRRTQPPTWPPTRTARTRPATWRPESTPRIRSKYDYVSFDVLTCVNSINVHKEKDILNLEYIF